MRLNARIHAELDLLTAQRILGADQAARIKERYPTGRWDLIALARWLGILGAVAAGTGVILLCAELDFRRTLLEIALTAVTVGLLVVAGRMRTLVRTRAALELCASLSLQGLTLELALHYSSGSDNWPGLVGAQVLLALGLAYALGNRLILIQALACAFVFFGGETGYASGWGAYWLGLSYPLRFLAVAPAVLALAWVHTRLGRDAWRAFARVYLHAGLLQAHLAFWFLAVFEDAGPLWSALWAAASAGSIWASGRIGLSTLRAYGFTFLVIDVYTFYFQFVAARSAELWFVHLLLMGGTLLALAFRVERWRRS